MSACTATWEVEGTYKFAIAWFPTFPGGITGVKESPWTIQERKLRGLSKNGNQATKTRHPGKGIK
jgi:hypothetical protein